MAINIVDSLVDGSAPTLSGTAGTLITVLDYCLVTISGWTQEDAGTNKASYRHASGDAYLRVVDDGSITTPGARQAKVRAYAAMTDVDTGTGIFPTTTQEGDDVFAIHKSTTADSTAREYYFVEDNGLFYLFIDSNVTYTINSSLVFGEFKSNLSGDLNNYIIGANASASASSTYGYTDWTKFQSYAPSVASGAYIQKDVAGVLESISVGVYPLTISGHKGTNNNIDNIISEANAGINLGEISITELYSGKVCYRGKLQGIKTPFEYNPWTNYDTLTDADAVDYMCFLTYSGFTLASYIAVQKTGTW